MKILILVVLVATDVAAAGPLLGPASSPPPPAPKSEPSLPPPVGAPVMPPTGGVPVEPLTGGAPFPPAARSEPSLPPPEGASAKPPPGGAPATPLSGGAPAMPPPGRTPFIAPPGGAPFMPPPGGAPFIPPPGSAPFMPPPGGAPFIPPLGGAPFMPPLGMLPPAGSPPSFANLAIAMNCTQSTDCSGDLQCCSLPCGRKCIPLVPDITQPDGPEVCPEEILKKLNISDQLTELPNPSSIKNCSQPSECEESLRCCPTPYGGKCMPTVSYNSSTESIVNMCPMDFFMMLFTPTHQPGGPMMPGPEDHPHPPDDPHPFFIDRIADQVNGLINGIAAEIKRHVPEESEEVEIVKDRIQEKVEEAFHHVQEKVEDGLEALETLFRLLKGNKIPQSKINEQRNHNQDESSES